MIIKDRIMLSYIIAEKYWLLFSKYIFRYLISNLFRNIL